MRFLAKTNPMATHESVIRHAKIFGVVTVVAYCGICIWYPGWREFWWLKLPAAVAFGAALGALMEWQLNDGLEFMFVIEEVEDEFKIEIPQADWAEIVTIGDLLNSCVPSRQRFQCGYPGR